MLPPIYNIFLASLLIFGDGFVSGGTFKKVVKPIDAKLLTFLTPAGENLILKHTGSSIEVNLIAPLTVGTATGGVLGSVLYKLRNFEFYFQSGNRPVLQSRIRYFKEKYCTYEEAAKQKDGLLDIFVPIDASGDKCNPLFFTFEKIFELMGKPGDTAYIRGGDSYGFYNHFNSNNSYTTSTTTSGIAITLQAIKGENFICKEQYYKTFGLVRDCWEKPMNNPLPPQNTTSSPVQGKGIDIINLPV